MSNKRKQKKRSNSFHISSSQNSIIEDFKDSNEEPLSKSIIVEKKKMTIVKLLQNIDLTTYDYIFVGRPIFDTVIQDFESFIKLLNRIKKMYNPKLLKVDSNIETIKKEGKLPLNNNNLTNLISFHKIYPKNIEISINNKYLKTSDLNDKFINFYGTKSFFKRKHCFEIEVLNMKDPNIAYGLINISFIEPLKEAFRSKFSLNITAIENINMENLNIFKLSNPIFYEDNKKFYNHFITYGDVLGLCFDLDQKLLYLFVNGVIRGTHILNVEMGTNCTFAPVISIGNFTEIIFNSGEKLKFEKNYRNAGFIPLDEKGKSYYDTSQLKKVTDEFIKILINNGKSIINNKNIAYSDINQIYHIIFDFLGNISFLHSYIIQNSFINLILEDNDNTNLEHYYICLKYILNCSKNKKIILKNIFFNLAENMHILLRKGQIKNINKVQKLFELFNFLFFKEEIINIFSKMPRTTRKIFKSIFVSFHISFSTMKNKYLDFLVSNNNLKIIHIDIIDTNNSNNSNNNNILFFPNIVISKNDLKKEIFLAKYDLNKSYDIISKFFTEFIILLFKNGIDTQNKYIFKIFKKFLEIQINRIFKSCFCKMSNTFNDIFKNIFLPAMDLFNQYFIKNDKYISIKKYLSKNETDGEKIGGTLKNIHDIYPKEIPNFEKLLNYTIKDYNNVIFMEIIYFFFIKEYSIDLWSTLDIIIKKYIDYINFGFLKSVKNDSIEKINIALVDYINFKLYQFNFYDLNIFLQFLYNLSDFIIKELYPQKLIYFLPEAIILKFEFIINILKNISILLKASYNLISNNNNNDKEKQSFIEERNNLITKLEVLIEHCFKQYLSIIVKIVGDENIKKLVLKCEGIKCINNYIYLNNYFTDDDIYSIFNFINFIHNNSEYKKFAINFMKIFENEMSLKESKYYNFGIRIIKLIKNNEEFLRILIILLYNNMNSSLSKLEERFCEYKFKPKSNQNNQNNQIYNNNDNDDNNNENDDNDNDNDINEVNNGLQAQLYNFIFGFPLLNVGNRNGRNRNQFIIFRRINNSQMNDKEKLALLEESFKDANNQFIKLINFYKISTDIKQLYDMNSFENKYLYNLLLSLYNIIFSPNNISKLFDDSNSSIINNVHYKKLLTNINIFYDILIGNILKQKNDNLLKEISRQRNIFHFKDILQILQKFNPPKNEKQKDKFIVFQSFIDILERIIPEEETLKSINSITINNGTESTRSGTKIDNNICPICADSIIDTHILPCEHSLCRNCLFQYLSENKICPFCRVEIKGIKEDPNFKI